MRHCRQRGSSRQAPLSSARLRGYGCLCWRGEGCACAPTRGRGRSKRRWEGPRRTSRRPGRRSAWPSPRPSRRGAFPSCPTIQRIRDRSLCRAAVLHRGGGRRDHEGALDGGYDGLLPALQARVERFAKEAFQEAMLGIIWGRRGTAGAKGAVAVSAAAGVPARSVAVPLAGRRRTLQPRDLSVSTSRGTKPRHAGLRTPIPAHPLLAVAAGRRAGGTPPPAASCPGRPRGARPAPPSIATLASSAGAPRIFRGNAARIHLRSGRSDAGTNIDSPQPLIHPKRWSVLGMQLAA